MPLTGVAQVACNLGSHEASMGNAAARPYTGTMEKIFLGLPRYKFQADPCTADCLSRRFKT